MTKTQTEEWWKKEFEKCFLVRMKYGMVASQDFRPPIVLVFIENLLSTQRSVLKEKIKGMPADQIMPVTKDEYLKRENVLDLLK
jgi:hypothetical protein